MENSPVKNSRLIAACCAVALLGGGAYYFSDIESSPIGVAHAAEGKVIAAPLAKITEVAGEQVAIFAGGCFWGLEGVYERVDGVIRVESGYAGGSKADADYGRVSDGETKHA